MRYLHLCFMTLTLSRVASFIAGTLLSLANRCEPSLHDSPSWVTNITMLSSRTVTDFDHVVCVRIICLFLFKLGSWEILSSSLSLSLLFCVSVSRGPSVNEKRGSIVRIFISLFTFSEERSRLFSLSFVVLPS